MKMIELYQHVQSYKLFQMKYKRKLETFIQNFIISQSHAEHGKWRFCSAGL